MTLNILILGGGFSGLAAAGPLSALAHRRRDVSVTMLDAHPYTTMIPALPDLAGGRFAEAHVTEAIVRRIGRRIAFQQQQVTSVDFDRQEVTTRQRTYPYDYLLVATGSVTNLFGFDQHLDAVHTLDSVEDAARIRREFADRARRLQPQIALVIGGGYTGLELACNLQFLGRTLDAPPHVVVVERDGDILPRMPDWVRRYMRKEAKQRGIEIVTGTAVETFDGNSVTLSNGRRMDDVFLCWATGTKFAIAELRGRQKQMKDGRLDVDECLRVPPYANVFAAGDSAAVRRGGAVLRKAVNFAIGSGGAAGNNIVAAIRGKPLARFRPVDMGWVIPFCDVGVGQIFSRLPVHGRVPLALHYTMCGVRHFNTRSRLVFWSHAVRALCGRRCAHPTLRS